MPCRGGNCTSQNAIPNISCLVSGRLGSKGGGYLYLNHGEYTSNCGPFVLYLTGMLVTFLLYLLITTHVDASCGGSCGACARRYGCMTPAWGKCCTQFFMHNGRKRASNPPGVMESFIEYVRLKSKVVNVSVFETTEGSVSNYRSHQL